MTGREKFEAWYCKNYSKSLSHMERHENSGDYFCRQTRAAWRAWQAAIASQQPADDGWIKCSERMPEVGQEVIVFDIERNKVQSGVMLQLGYPAGMGNVFVDFNEEYYKVANVELWQQLPSAPEDV